VQRRLLPAPPGDLAVHREIEPGHTQATGADQLAAVAVDNDGHGRGPAPRPERLPGGVQARRPHALEQGADLLDLGDDLHDQLLAAGAEMTQPAPRLVDRFGQVAAQLSGRRPSPT
jgi:hypothetical protein